MGMGGYIHRLVLTSLHQAVSQIVDSSKGILFSTSEMRLEGMLDFVTFLQLYTPSFKNCSCISHS